MRRRERIPVIFEIGEPIEPTVDALADRIAKRIKEGW